MLSGREATPSSTARDDALSSVGGAPGRARGSSGGGSDKRGGAADRDRAGAGAPGGGETAGGASGPIPPSPWPPSSRAKWRKPPSAPPGFKKGSSTS